MVKVLVPTKPDDIHAVFVKLALEKNGHQVDLWYTTDFPSKQTHTFTLQNNDMHWLVNGLNLKLDSPQYDVVWHRRPSKAILPHYIHPEDYDNARKENNMLLHTLWRVILPEAKWINPVSAALRSHSKLLQLKLASKIGMKVPDTLISNDPLFIKNLIEKNENKIIYKTLYPVAWLKENEVRLTYTKLISKKDLPSDPVLQCTPGIFQKKIDKKYEIRATYFGDHYIAVKIDSQKNEKTKMDWRAAPTNELLLEQILLPKNLDSCCRKLMQVLGIVFACFDFIVTPQDEYYFLEVNEQGQFLWIEDVNPNIKMLKAFSEFIATQHHLKAKMPEISLADFEKEAENLQRQAMQCHVNSPRYN